ncbi:MAG: PQQ-dependent sugar dehydrogenase [Dehalococcoidia bacterium]
MRLRSAAWLLLAVVTSAATACSGDGDAAPTTGAVASATPTVEATATPAASPTETATPAATATATASPSPSPAPTAAATASPEPTATPASAGPPRVVLVEAFPERFFSRPIEIGGYPGGRVFVADQGGLIVLLDRSDGGASQTELLDLSAMVSRGGNEEGLLSVALDPDFASNGYLYTYYSAASPRRSVLSRFTVPAGSDVADAGSELVILEVGQPFRNHNGGAVRFGPDGMLYLGFGDGGSGGDPRGNGQDPSTLLGSVIRIDVRGASEARPYVIPSDNPIFAAALNARPETWAYGFRNPWRMAFDPATGALWLADVGQDAVEEIDVVTAGSNYGWNRLEGESCYSPASGCERAGTVLPLATYTHADGCSISGGAVYRGDAVPALRGWYVYGDFCTGTIWSLPADGSQEPAVLVASDLNIASFGVDGAGELYVLDFGVIFRFAQAP